MAMGSKELANMGMKVNKEMSMGDQWNQQFTQYVISQNVRFSCALYFK